jgi:hypothetical protein
LIARAEWRDLCGGNAGGVKEKKERAEA